MAKKNSQKDTSGVVFDTHSKMVMSQGGTFERMKEKIKAVRAVVPNKSNNEIALVLQHFENCVDRAVQAFVEGSAVEILKEWNVTGKKKSKKKKKPKPQPEPEPAPSALPPDGAQTHNGFHANGSVVADGESLDSLSEQLDSASLDAELDSAGLTSPDLLDLTVPEAAPPPVSSGHQGSRGNKFRPRPASQHAPVTSSSNPSDGQTGAPGVRKVAPNIDRSLKDLQRCTASLTRYRVLVKDEMDSSIKRMKQTFAELQSCLMDREVALLAEMDKVKAEAMDILDGRQKRAEELKRLTDRSATMSDDQLTELRADIKHFVSERKYDEDLGKAVKFTYDLEPLKASIGAFGQVYHPQTGYSSRSRCSSSSSSFVGQAVQTPPVTQPQATPSSGRPAQSHPQGYQGNRRGGQRYNSSYHDRNPGRGGYRYHSDRYHGDRYHGDGTNTRAPTQPSSSSSRPDRPAHNGLPQRPPRTHCP
ncbi:spermatogenesis-associated serine-rich protein 2 [Denticeps clupeoides]|uniref:Spermatogenesis-associated serine-rich protein 2 n=1 Tax=Denticeps clupeoides TaxID=299321 RepID=A0AAY4BWH5_9TELE|nr:spermatogenesis-associated serine-rich protein 2 [Denticeps clupeoides]XP_028824372.1 spermatogenesis-associated serine-rich protein 2 [Denticeps clupeoides]XP_028824373.1 spermatogenesis-associated serine-rich protein 2 [Denticeps clupeoides]XP_028824374.1 spermatogenesis-associated serine-rich protein 2 [Denticeps clupeoides]